MPMLINVLPADMRADNACRRRVSMALAESTRENEQTWVRGKVGEWVLLDRSWLQRDFA